MNDVLGSVRKHALENFRFLALKNYANTRYLLVSVDFPHIKPIESYTIDEGIDLLKEHITEFDKKN